MRPEIRQVDVFANPRPSRTGIPFFVIIQSSRFATTTRLVAPLIRAGGQRAETELAPVFSIGDEELYLDPLLIQALPIASFGASVASLADDDSAGRIRNAIEEALTTAFG